MEDPEQVSIDDLNAARTDFVFIKKSGFELDFTFEPASDNIACDKIKLLTGSSQKK